MHKYPLFLKRTSFCYKPVLKYKSTDFNKIPETNTLNYYENKAKSASLTSPLKPK